LTASDNGAPPIGRVSRWCSGGGLGGLAAVTKEPSGARQVGDDGEQAHAPAAARTSLDIHRERPPEQLSPRPIARAAFARRRASYFPLTLCARRGAGGTRASTDGWGQAYSNSILHLTSAPRLPSDELEMSFTLSYEPSTDTRGESCHSTLERSSRDSATPLVTLARMRSARRLELPQLAGARPAGPVRLRSSPKTVLARALAACR